jgi:quercetin dioxygenase-like cupin family protein
MVLLAVVPVAGAVGVTAQDAATPEAATGEVVREVLGSAEPAEADGELLQLSRYTIPAGAVLPVHTHPGVQMATVESGTLTYHVVSDGEVVITRADGTTETALPGDTVTFEVGDSWVEPEGMVHWAENLTDQPVVLLSASLFGEDEPLSTVIEATPES